MRYRRADTKGGTYFFTVNLLEKIDEVVTKNYGSLELLKERRTSLISAAVTGKIDVRNWGAPNKETMETSV